MNSTITDRIRKQLEQPDGLTVETLQPLADLFSHEVVQVNARLAECIQLLRKGLRSEAIQRANMRPNVLDWSAQLDFPELDDWLGIVQFFGIPSPTNLDRDAAQQIQEAIVDEQPLEELLRQHRRLAIAKAPLPWRLKVLRRLRQVDSANPVWTEDQQIWETVRLKQIPAELTKAIDSKELDACNVLAAELNLSAWLVRPADELRQRAASAADQLVHSDQSLRLRAIGDQLHAAFSEGNVAGARKGQFLWQQLLSSMKTPPSMEIVQLAEPALDWLSQQDAAIEKDKLHTIASAKLQKLLEGDCALAELQRAYYDVIGLELGLDPILERRFVSRINELQQRSKRRTQFAFFFVATATVLMIALFGFWQWNQAKQKRIIVAQKELQSLLDERRFEDGEDYWKRLETQSPDLAKSPGIAALGSRLLSSVSEEQARKARVVELIKKADNDEPSRIDLENLRAAEKAAQTDEEKAQVAKLRRAVDRYETQIHEQQFDAVKDALTEAESRMKTLEEGAALTIDESELQAMISELSKLPVQYPKAGSQAQRLVDLTIQKFASLRDSVRREVLRLQNKMVLTKKIRETTTLPEYQERLESYVRELPADSQTAEIAEALQDKDRWKIPLLWNAWCISLEGSLKDGINSTEATQSLDALAKIKEKLTGNSALQSFPQIESYLENIKSRSPLLTQLVDDLENAVLAELVTVINATPPANGINSDQRNRRFMSYEDRAKEADKLKMLSEKSGIGLQVVTDGNGSVTRETFNGKPIFKEEPRASIRKLVKRFRDKPDETIADWDTQMIVAIREISENPDMDSAIKMLLLPRLLVTATDGSSTLKRAFSNVVTKIGEENESRGGWFAAQVFSSDLSVGVAANLKQAVVDASNGRAAEDLALKNFVKRKFLWVGGLIRDDAGKLGSWLMNGRPPDGQLLTVVADGGNPEIANLVSIGTIQDGQSNIQTIAHAVAGRPLFFLRK